MKNQAEQLRPADEKTLLPLGSVVLLRDVYPEGYIDENFSFLFNHEDIDVVAHVGFSNYEEEAFQKILQEVSPAK